MEFKFSHSSGISKLNRKMIVRIVLISSLITSIITIISLVNDYKSEMSKLERSLEQIKGTNLKNALRAR